MKKTNIVDPFELCNFIESHYGVGNDIASNITSYVSPECEVKTFNYDKDEIEREIADCPEEEAAYPEWPASPNQILLAFMKHHDVTQFTLTQ